MNHTVLYFAFILIALFFTPFAFAQSDNQNQTETVAEEEAQVETVESVAENATESETLAEEEVETVEAVAENATESETVAEEEVETVEAAAENATESKTVAEEEAQVETAKVVAETGTKVNATKEESKNKVKEKLERIELKTLDKDKLKKFPLMVGRDEAPKSAEKVDRKENFKILKEIAEKKEKVRVIVGLNLPFTPEGKLSLSKSIEQRNNIKSLQEELIDDVSSLVTNDVYQFERIPLVTMDVDKKTLEMLEASSIVSEIYEDTLSFPTLLHSVPLIQAPTAWNNGYTGAGQTIAILDTGVDKNHPFLAGKVVSEACYSSNKINDQATSLCVNAATEDTSANSALPCTIDGCFHGTHVAGIAAGKNPSYSGVARDANIIAIQVFSQINDPFLCNFDAPCIGTYTSDVIKGLQRVDELSATYDISSVNLSFGGSAFTNPCDSDLRKPAVDLLKSKGIATVASSGNGDSNGDGYINAIVAPSCISSVVSVGSTTVNSHGTGLPNDAVSSFSNTASFLDLLAPGEFILSAIPGGPYALAAGTSMSAPHVSGAWAILKQNNPGASVDEILDMLKSSGLQKSHFGNTFSRINPAAALDTKAPTAVDDTGAGFVTDEATMITTGSVLTNDSDPNGNPLTVESIDTTGTLGSVVNNGDGTFSYNPNNQFELLNTGQSTTDSFSYKINDGTGWTGTATVTITINGIDEPPPPPSNWYNVAWLHRKQITIDSNQVNSDLVNFPLLVRTTDPDLIGKTLSNGDDILFTASDGITKLPHEIEKYNSVTGELVAWVNVPLVSGSTDTVIFQYYGNAATTDQQNTQGTWNSNYKIVYHLNGTFIDSTASPITATNTGSSAATDQYIGDSRSFDNANDSVDIPDSAKLTATDFTLMAWVDMTSSGAIDLIVDHLHSTAVSSYGMYVDADGTFHGFGKVTSGTSIDTDSGVAIAGKGWKLVVFKRSDSANARHLCVDGTCGSPITDAGTGNFDPNLAMYIGERGHSSQFPFGGRIDEVRFMDIALSNDWISSEYNNQKLGSSFIAIGLEQTVQAAQTEPVAITNLSAVSGDLKVTLSWSKPFDGGSPITDYIVEFKQSSNPTFNTFNDGVNSNNMAIVTGLQNGVLYDFKVKAVNAIGSAQGSNIVTEMPQPPSPFYVKRASLIISTNVFCEIGDVATGGGFTGMFDLGIIFTNAPITSSGELANNGNKPVGWKITGLVLDPTAEAFVVCNDLTP